MSDPTLKTSLRATRTVEPLDAAEMAVDSDQISTTQQSKIPLTVRSRLRVLRVAPPIDDGFRPFRVF